jgi:hypothetical protein
LFHPLLIICRATTSNFLLMVMSVSLACSLCCNWAQKRSQYAPLKITFKIELNFDFLKTISFRYFHITQQMAMTPTQIRGLQFYVDY